MFNPFIIAPGRGDIKKPFIWKTEQLLARICWTLFKKYTTSAILREPKDEIELEKVKEATVEKEVNYVGEYIYDTKLENDELHKQFWKTLNFNFK